MSAILLKRAASDQERFADRVRAMEEIEALPLDKEWRIEIEEAKCERSLQQNKYLFGVAYTLISDKTGYEKDDLHTYLLGLHFGTRLKRVPRSKYNPQGLMEVPVRTTTTDANGRRSVLGRMEFSEYVDFVKRFAAEKCQIFVPDPNPAYQIYREREAA